jgi:hypothetical protein
MEPIRNKKEVKKNYVFSKSPKVREGKEETGELQVATKADTPYNCKLDKI